MSDAAIVVLIVVFSALSLGFVIMCDRLMGRRW
jgi:hypothetical protein